MKKTSFLILAFSIFLTSAAFAMPEDFKTYTKSLNVNGVNKSVNIVEVNLNNKDIEFEVVTANDRVIGSEAFTSMINRKKPNAAINANFFAAYDTLQPYGSIVKNGRFTYLEGKNTSLIIDKDNKLDIKNFSTKIKGYINGKRENKWNNANNSMDYYLFDIWYVNVVPQDSGGVYMFTPERGDKISLNTGTVIEVKKDIITNIKKNPGDTVIPKDGYLIYYGKDAAGDTYVGNRFKKGRTIELEYDIIASAANGKLKEEEKGKEEKVLSSKNTKLFGSIDKKIENKWNNEKNAMDFNLFNIWYINTDPIDSGGVYLYTPEKGESIKVPGGHSVNVENGKIKNIEYNIKTIDIPKNGYVIYFGGDAVGDTYIKNRFKTGQTIDFYHEKTFELDTKSIIQKAVKDNEAAISKSTVEATQTEIKSNDVKSMISAGPFLVDEGKIIIDSDGGGFKEDKISKDRAQRSALGITKDNKLILLTGSNLNMQELGQVMIQLNCEKAMNLDGGASSALYGNGKLITPAGRNLNTVLMIHDRIDKDKTNK